MTKSANSRVIMVKNVPHGFYEKEMMEFFSQFGPVTRLKLLRSRKYLKSKGIAFVEFAYDDVAKIVAHTMDNYLMFEKLLKCEVVQPGKLPKGVFKNWKKPKVSSITTHKKISGKSKNNAEWKKLKAKKIKLIKEAIQKLEALGISYECTIIEKSDDESEDEDVKDESDFVSLKDDSEDESFVSCDSKPSPRLIKAIKSLSEKKFARSGSSMKRKLLYIPKFAFLRAAKRLSL
ncbi:MKI67 FHA domain-interacting nucleolar phosphoprotein-like [Tetranychus urticae]|uniref:RRM domain-containing protein n=1 Tax=Tetranychus urticae TaxID=32264 RepID=T1KQY1_TETUR|nr:MKI67 FHA domain-interacting nucleolar phosphoprotein-like [Tetranychus urticae]